MLFGANSTENPNQAKVEIAGDVENIHDSFSTYGFSFKVIFTQVKYRGTIHHIAVTKKSPRQYVFQVAMRNANLNFNRTAIRGSRHRADCGPLRVRLGSRRNIWLQFDARLFGERLKLVKSHFKLDKDNYSVGSPAWVKTSGLGMTQSKVISGLRSGLASNRKTVEAKFLQEMPDIFEQIKGDLALRIPVAKVASN